MTIYVFSDTHGNRGQMRTICQENKPDIICHCGDFARDADGLDAYAVSGNCDAGSLYQTELTFQAQDKIVWMTHGHNFGVKQSLNRLWFAAKERNADIVLFGHTHIPLYDRHEKIVLCNPGSLAFPASGAATYAVITIENGQVGVEIKKI